MPDIQSGTTVSIANDIVVGGAVTFARGEQVTIQQVSPNPERPEYKYTVFSSKANQWFQLRDEDVVQPQPVAAPPPQGYAPPPIAPQQQASFAPPPLSPQQQQAFGAPVGGNLSMQGAPPGPGGGRQKIPKQGKPPKQKGSKKTLIVVIIVVLVLAAGGVAAYLILGKKDNKSSTSTTTTTSSSPATSQNSGSNNYSEKDLGVPLYPNLQYDQSTDASMGNLVMFKSSDPMATVVSWYQQKLSGKPEYKEKPMSGLMASQDFTFKDGDVYRFMTVSDSKAGTIVTIQNEGNPFPPF